MRGWRGGISIEASEAEARRSGQRRSVGSWLLERLLEYPQGGLSGGHMLEAFKVLFANKFSTSVIALFGAAAVVLVLMGKLSVSHNEKGWRVCVPCEKGKDDSGPNKESTEQKDIPAKVSSNSDKSSLESILKIPLRTHISAAKAMFPITEKSDGTIQYEQTLFGENILINEALDKEGFTESFSFQRSITYVNSIGGDSMPESIKAAVASSCEGEKYFAFVHALSIHFGQAKVVEETTNHNGSVMGYGSAYGEGIVDETCARSRDKRKGCIDKMETKVKVTEFSKDALGIFRFTTSLLSGSIAEDEPNSIAYQKVLVCKWDGKFIPKQ